MTQPPDTSESLLLRLRNPDDHVAWNRFDAIYRPVVYRVARKWGWQDSDAQDLVQRVMMSVANAVPEWQKDVQKGSFRNWLHRVARNSLISALRQSPREVAIGGSDFLDRTGSLEDPSNELESLILQEHQRRRLCLAAELIQKEFKESSWRAFWLTTLEDRTVEEASRILNLTLGAVYAARSRIMRRLQEVAQSMNTDDEN
ncbi:MAG: sigma-70 family RNA polymerase sigma factor [Pirellula sp.]